tara:strand:- start:11207 stop:11881 length:675 start_codon:yes stop_codon:yes gene_type:complete
MNRPKKITRDEIDRLTDSLEEAVLGDHDRIFAIRESLKGLDARIEGSPLQSQSVVLESVQRILGEVLRRGDVTEKLALEIARDLTGHLAENCEGRSPKLQLGVTSPAMKYLGIDGETDPPPAPGMHETQEMSVDLINETRLGHILVKMGVIDFDVLDRALGMQRLNGKKLGEVLVAMEAIGIHMLNNALDRQREETLRLAGGMTNTPFKPDSSSGGLQMRNPRG